MSRTETTSPQDVVGVRPLTFPACALGPDEYVRALWLVVTGDLAEIDRVSVANRAGAATLGRSLRGAGTERWTQVDAHIPVDKVKVRMHPGAAATVHLVWELITVPWVRLTWLGLTCGAATALALDDTPKMVVVVNHGLRMGNGKIAAQVGHAVSAVTEVLVLKHPELWAAYKAAGHPKIVLRAPDTAAMAAFAALPNAHAVRDDGRTQVAPGSLTAVGFPPGGTPDACRELRLL
jgi:PTH2 family peptidyl-tRNA hydrolase